MVAIFAVHLLNCFTDPTKDPNVRIAMKRMRCTLGRSANQTRGIRHDMVNLLLANVSYSIRSLGDAALMQLAYDNLCCRSDSITLRIDAQITTTQGIQSVASFCYAKAKQIR